MIPKIEEVLKCYPIIAIAERAKTGRPGVKTVLNAVSGAKCTLQAAGIKESEEVTRITRKAIDDALVAFLGRGLSRISAWSYVCQLRAVFARWCDPYYKDAGWEIPKIELPTFRARPPRYVRPPAEMLDRVSNWYRRLEGELWFAATMMLEFAMRNGDILRLKDENFVEKRDEGSGMGDECGIRHFLSYTPHKTALSSGRRVYWPIHDAIWQKFDDYGGLAGLDVVEETFEEINSEMRVIGFRGSKGAYELRKICIDHIYQRFGAEMASSISGDEIKTITHYYADPAQPNVGAIRVIDLL
ncbi:MAG: hypothetical protein KBT68_00340 [bacterium]|nr:hypothetical protein [Candidatus Colisoma equi]